jgi:hypothetical protein
MIPMRISVNCLDEMDHVRFGSKAEVAAGLLHIRFAPEIGHLPHARQVFA